MLSYLVSYRRSLCADLSAAAHKILGCELLKSCLGVIQDGSKRGDSTGVQVELLGVLRSQSEAPPGRGKGGMWGPGAGGCQGLCFSTGGLGSEGTAR